MTNTPTDIAIRIERLEAAVRYLASLQSLPYNLDGDPNVKNVSGHEDVIEQILADGLHGVEPA